MESLTKYRQNEETIRRMVQKFFPETTMKKYRELTEGYFNAAYEITLADHREVILKIAPRQDMRVMTYEKNIMYSEVSAIDLAGKNPGIPVPKILGYDPGRTVCESPYFFMEKLEGSSLHAIRDTLTKEEIGKIYEEAGRIGARINQISCPCFGYPGQREYQGQEWDQVFEKMLHAAVRDARAGEVDMKIQLDPLWEAYEKDRAFFQEVTEAKLVHWDCWDGNIFVKNGRITGIIDWERCIWGDPLLEVGFREYDKNLSYQKGYGKTSFTRQEEKRILWYDVYLFLLVSLECEYRKYDTMEMYGWASEMLGKQLEKIVR